MYKAYNNVGCVKRCPVKVNMQDLFGNTYVKNLNQITRFCVGDFLRGSVKGEWFPQVRKSNDRYRKYMIYEQAL